MKHGVEVGMLLKYLRTHLSFREIPTHGVFVLETVSGWLTFVSEMSVLTAFMYSWALVSIGVCKTCVNFFLEFPTLAIEDMPSYPD